MAYEETPSPLDESEEQAAPRKVVWGHSPSISRRIAADAERRDAEHSVAKTEPLTHYWRSMAQAYDMPKVAWGDALQQENPNRKR